MKNKKREARQDRGGAGPRGHRAALAARGPGFWPWWARCVVVFWAYSPALHGEFLFDDNVLPFALPNAAAPLRAWIGQIRPVLMFTYWINSRISADDPYSYHVFNVIIHCLTSLLIFLMVRRLLEWSGAQASLRNLLAGFAAAAVSAAPRSGRIRGLPGGPLGMRSASCWPSRPSPCFCIAARPAVSWATVAAVLALFGAALLSKEHTVVLPALLLLTDYWWNPGFSFQGIRRNWKLYAAHGPRRGRGRGLFLEPHHSEPAPAAPLVSESRNSPGISTSSPSAAPCSCTSACSCCP